MRNLALSLLAVVLIATIGLGWMFDGIYNKYLNQNSDQNNSQSINQTQQQPASQQQDYISVLERVGTHLSTTLGSLDNRQQFIDNWPTDGQLSLHLKPLSSFPLPQALLNDLTAGQPLLLETDDSIALHFYLVQTNELLVLTTPPQSVSQKNTLLPILLTSLFYLAVLALMLLWLYPLAKRLMTLRQTAKSFGEGNLNKRIDVGSISYIRDLELEFNRMAQRIDDLVNDIKLLSSAVSHDLRTPLARIRFGIDTIQEEDDPVLRKRFEQRISDNVDEMVDLVETLLSYARLDQTLITLDKAPVDFTALITTCINNKYQDEIELTFKAPEQALMVYGDISYLSILVANLLQNAYQYCHRKIHVELTEQGQMLILSIADDGQGIAIEQREKIIKPFIRGEANDKKVKGYGMGLAIVKRVVEWHQGNIHIDNSATLSGAEFIISLPKANYLDK